MEKPNLNITVISDVHYYSPSLGTSGRAYETANMRSVKLLAGSRELIEAAFEQIGDDERSEIVIIPGDLTCDGDYQSHSEIIELLRRLKAKKRIYLIFSTHDYQNNGLTNKYCGDEVVQIPAAKREELWDMYFEFGANEAISTHPQSMSYVVQLAEGYRLFALNDDCGDNGKSGFTADCMKWIEEQARDARENGQFILAMTHHPLVAPSPVYELVGGDHDMHGNYKQQSKELADMGVQFMFTGHTHTHNIGRVMSEKGNAFYGISTASLVGYPAVIRNVCVMPARGVVDVTTDWVTYPVNIDLGGRTLPEYLDNQLTGMIRDILDAAATDTKKLAYLCVAISIKPELIRKIGPFIRLPAKWLNKTTFKTFGRWTRRKTGFKREDYAAVANDRVVDFIIGLARNLYAGEDMYSTDDVKYKIFAATLDKFDGILRALHVDISSKIKVASSLRELLEPLAHNMDIKAYDAQLPIFHLTE